MRGSPVFVPILRCLPSRVAFLGAMRGFLHSRARSSLIPPTPFSHKGRRGSLGVLMAETGDGTQGLAKKSTPVSIPPTPFSHTGRRGSARRPDAQNARSNAGASRNTRPWMAACGQDARAPRSSADTRACRRDAHASTMGHYRCMRSG
jgi:hypothetical protein